MQQAEKERQTDPDASVMHVDVTSEDAGTRWQVQLRREAAGIGLALSLSVCILAASLAMRN